MTEVKNLPALSSKGGGVSLPGGKFRVKSQVTRTVLQQFDEVPFYVRFESAIGISKMDPANSKYKDKEGEGVLPEVANVFNLETGEFQVLICNAVLASELRRAYPADDYVNREFGIRRGKSEIDKRYKVYTIIEIEREADDEGRTVGVGVAATIDATSQEAIDVARKGRHKVA